MQDPVNEFPSKNKSWWTYPILLLCVIIWGSNFIIGKVLVDHFDPYSITVIRLIAINLFLWLFASRHFHMPMVPLKVWLVIISSGIIGIAVNQYTFFLGLVTASPVTSALILAVAPIMTAILTIPVFGERRGLKFWLGALLAFAGVSLSTFDGSALTFGLGEGIIVITMLTFAIFMILIQWLSQHINAIQLTLLSNFSGLLFLLPFLPAADYGRLASSTWPMWLLLMLSGIIVHGISNMIWNREMPKVGAANASLLMNMEPFVAMLGTALVLGSSVLVTEVIGAILIIGGVTLSIHRRRRSKTTVLYD